LSNAFYFFWGFGCAYLLIFLQMVFSKNKKVKQDKPQQSLKIDNRYVLKNKKGIHYI